MVGCGRQWGSRPVGFQSCLLVIRGCQLHLLHGWQRSGSGESESGVCGFTFLLVMVAVICCCHTVVPHLYLGLATICSGYSGRMVLLPPGCWLWASAWHCHCHCVSWCWAGGEAYSPVCGFAFSLVMAAASARLPHCCATSLPVTWFSCNMRWLLRLDCCFCPAGPLNCCVRAAARLLPCCCDS